MSSGVSTAAAEPYVSEAQKVLCFQLLKIEIKQFLSEAQKQDTCCGDLWVGFWLVFFLTPEKKNEVLYFSGLKTRG